MNVDVTAYIWTHMFLQLDVAYVPAQEACLASDTGDACGEVEEALRVLQSASK